eukprot:TRINITY_DN16928_c1_g1_i1.p1 TRINITY_DN16928_c1_g1~~TRINITY_DN16928_c1_g1_i1.p1  ORF type:complete len:296 (-),score=74.80 TRINITY_DN16928_c1_g1_i1:146-1033(-)
MASASASVGSRKRLSTAAKTTAAAPPVGFGKRLSSKKWKTIDIDLDSDTSDGDDTTKANSSSTALALVETKPSTLSSSSSERQLAVASSALVARQDPRIGVRLLLTKALAEVASKEKVHIEPAIIEEWMEVLETAIWRSIVSAGQRYDEDGSSIDPSQRRRYIAEARRLGTAIREGSGEGSVLEALLMGGAAAAAKLVILPPEELLPLAKRQRLEELQRQQPQVTVDIETQFPLVDERMACVDCEKIGSIRYKRVADGKEGFAKAEIWGSKENDDKGERCMAFCPDCLAEWPFEY